MSTPHRGSDATRWPELLANIANTGTWLISGLSGSMRKDLLEGLQRNSSMLEKISTAARNQLEGIQIYSFYEQKSTPPLSRKVRAHITLILLIAV